MLLRGIGGSEMGDSDGDVHCGLSVENSHRVREDFRNHGRYETEDVIKWYLSYQI